MIPPEIEQLPFRIRLRRAGAYGLWTSFSFALVGAAIGALFGTLGGGIAYAFGGVGLIRAAIIFLYLVVICAIGGGVLGFLVGVTVGWFDDSELEDETSGNI